MNKNNNKGGKGLIRVFHTVQRIIFISHIFILIMPLYKYDNCKNNDA